MTPACAFERRPVGAPADAQKAMPKTKLQMLLRGQNLLGYKHYADDMVDLFVKKAIENGIDVIRIFDALNDTRNFKAAMDATNKYGGWAEAAISYTTSPVHSLEYFTDLACELEQMGAKSICIKDMANLLLPYDAYELVKASRRASVFRCTFTRTTPVVLVI